MAGREDAMDDFYTPDQRALQDRFGRRTLADRLEAAIVSEALDEKAMGFIESRDFFFLSTVDADGTPTVSHKGGPVGLVRALDRSTLVFPSCDGNGMYLSMGNVAATGRIGMLFLDFETPHRIRVQARARLTDDPATLALFPGAEVAVRAEVTRAFVNCPRYIHPHSRSGTARHVPDAKGCASLPSWKRIDMVQDVLGADERAAVDAAGGTITPEEYEARLARGEA
jgi:predicted pyridoxine 5'-phosphate oxidase superfamily flavin-nucleotide-binding protein